MACSNVDHDILAGRSIEKHSQNSKKHKVFLDPLKNYAAEQVYVAKPFAPLASKSYVQAIDANVSKLIQAPSYSQMVVEEYSKHCKTGDNEEVLDHDKEVVHDEHSNSIHDVSPFHDNTASVMVGTLENFTTNG